MKRGLLWALLGAVAAGCHGVPLRPDGSPGDELCPPGAREAITALGLSPGNAFLIWPDATRAGGDTTLPLIVSEGPVESVIRTSFDEPLPVGTRLQGRIWTSGPRVVIRYYSAQFPDGRRIPFCAVAADDGPGLPKGPGPPGLAALRDQNVIVYVTGQFK